MAKPCATTLATLNIATDALSQMIRFRQMAMQIAALSASAFRKHSRPERLPHGFDLFLAGRL